MDTNNANFEAVLNIVGHRGPMQLLIIAFNIAQETTAALSLYYFIFAESKNPSWTCAPSENWNKTLNITTDNFCPENGTKCANLTYDVEFSSIVTEWDLICEKSYLSTLTVSLFLAGLLIGTFISGQLVDLFGRRKIILTGWALIMVLQTLIGVMPNFIIYATFRLLIGICTGGLVAVDLVLPMEYVDSTWRVVVSLRMGWRVAYFTLIGLAYVIRQWRHLAFACGSICAIFFPIAIFCMPESARWSLKKGRYEEAHYWLKLVSKVNRKSCPDMEFLKKVALSVREESKAGKGTKKYSYIDLLRGKDMAIMTLVNTFAWFTLACTEYCLVTMTSNLSGDVYANMAIMGTINFFSRLSALLVLNINRIGRRGGFVLYMVFTLLCVIGMMINELVNQDEDSMVTTWLVIAGFGGMSGAWSSIALFIPEMYPTLLRGLASSVTSAMSRVGSVIAPQVVFLGTFHPSAPFIILCLLDAACIGLVVVFLSETINQPLPEDAPGEKSRSRSIVPDTSVPIEELNSPSNESEKDPQC